MPPTTSGNSKTKTHQMLARAARRLRWCHLGRHFFNAGLVIAVLFAAFILVTRLTSAIPDVLSYPSLAIIPGLAFAIAWFTHPRVSTSSAASVVDQHQANHDLFLTTVHLDGSAGDYQEKVRERAESLATKDVPLAKIVPWHWQRRAAILAFSLGLLALAIALLPRLDPFGKQEERAWLDKQQQRLAELRAKTQEVVQTRRPDELAKQGETIQQALTDLEKAFRAAKPENKRETANKISDSQKELGRFWKQLNDEKLGKALADANDKLQHFGQRSGTDPRVAEFQEKLRELLRRGDAKEINQALAEMLQKTEDLQSSGQSPQQQQQGAKELRQTMQDLAEAVSKEAQAPQINQSLQRAIEQLQAAQNADLSDQALRDAQQSLESLQQQLQDLGEQLKQLEAMERALDAAQLAQQLNDLGKLGEGQSGKGAATAAMRDYAELYKDLLAQQGQGAGGTGMGMGGSGSGEGGTAPEDDSLASEFKTEQSKSSLVAGKMLMEWKTKGVSETGKVTEEFRDSVRELKQGITEAIRNEQIPAGYHDQIKRYFDTLPEAPPVGAEGLD